MDLEAKIIEAMRIELSRQAEEQGGDLTMSDSGPDLQISGRVDLEALAMAIAGSVAGGP